MEQRSVSFLARPLSLCLLWSAAAVFVKCTSSWSKLMPSSVQASCERKKTSSLTNDVDKFQKRDLRHRGNLKSSQWGFVLRKERPDFIYNILGPLIFSLQFLCISHLAIPPGIFFSFCMTLFRRHHEQHLTRVFFLDLVACCFTQLSLNFKSHWSISFSLSF